MLVSNTVGINLTRVLFLFNELIEFRKEFRKLRIVSGTRNEQAPVPSPRFDRGGRHRRVGRIFTLDYLHGLF